MLVGKGLYRALLREAKLLPDNRLSEHYTAKVRTAFREERHPESSERALRRIKRAQKLLRHLQAANEGYLHSVTRAYETAYGVRGKVKHAILAVRLVELPLAVLRLTLSLQPFLEPGRKRSNFPPALAALVTSSFAHSSRPPSPADLLKPPSMPERADPTSEQARLLGPLIPQRIRAIKRRFWNNQTGRMLAPVAVKVVQGKEEVDDAETASRLLKRHAKLNVVPEHLIKGWKRIRDLEAKSSSSLPKLPPRRLQTVEQRQNRSSPLSPVSARRIISVDARRSLVPAFNTTKWKSPRVIRPRLLRRRVQTMLQKMPTLTVRVPAAKSDEDADKVANRKDKRKEATFAVQLSEKAAGEKGRYREMTEEERWWLEKETVPSLKVWKEGKKV
ncbi:hypothetical protein Rt10032_c05g2470 [Rhodotorula toruloides]|uniref:LYR motif-containing protein Cup1-like N-terminal domain-containing protein n=1 Tax=Rhodotorula toruloides TaxID=5286 RepID=A0A511KDL9_RHOTO|nr:hypothetical protein Rt10032_c05g2470 [Rhodotorula toruloides]